MSEYLNLKLELTEVFETKRIDKPKKERRGERDRNPTVHIQYPIWLKSQDMEMDNRGKIYMGDISSDGFMEREGEGVLN